jgi:hypothetical protein
MADQVCAALGHYHGTYACVHDRLLLVHPYGTEVTAISPGTLTSDIRPVELLVFRIHVCLGWCGSQLLDPCPLS